MALPNDMAEVCKMLEMRNVREVAATNRESLLAWLKLGYAAALVFGYLALGACLLAFKSNAAEAQWLYGVTVLTAIASGSAGYAFGKKQDKPQKE